MSIPLFLEFSFVKYFLNIFYYPFFLYFYSVATNTLFDISEFF